MQSRGLLDRISGSVPGPQFLPSFFDAKTTIYIGLDNYIFAFTDNVMPESFRNNPVVVSLGTGFPVSFGLLIAMLADRFRQGLRLNRREILVRETTVVKC